MPIHEEVLNAARQLCSERGSRTFTAEEIVRALPHLKKGSVKTHIFSRCCVDAPPHHAVRHPYFRRVGHGEYEIAEAYRSASS